METQEIKYTIQVNEEYLNTLFKEVIDGFRDDLSEAQTNIEAYLDEINKGSDGRGVYGSLYNDALKIKGMVRERQLKALNMFKDRVTVKERIDLESGKSIKPGSTNMSPSMMNDIVAKMIKSKKETVVELTSDKTEIPPPAPQQFNPPSIDDGVNYEEEDELDNEIED